MNKKIFIFMIMICIVLSACNQKKNNINQNMKYETSIEKSANLLDSNYNNENIMVSELSLDFALGLVGNGSNEELLNDIEKYLGENIFNFNNFSKSYINANKKVKIANNAYIRKDNGIQINKEYKNTIKKYYNADTNIESFDSGTVNNINSWVDKSTNGFIKKIVDDVSDYDSVLINVIYFKDEWKDKIEKYSIVEEDFTLFNKDTVKTQMMYDSAYDYYENDFASGFSKKYKNDGIVFIGILPKNEGEFNLSDLDLEGLIKTKRKVDNLNVKFPKFEFENSMNLNDYLKDNGLEKLFDGNINNIINNELTVNVVLQDTKIKVDEDGTEAAAVTSVMMENTAFVEKEMYYVYLDRPFAFIIYDEINKIPLFVGKVVNPSK